jgi:hypothetical protein
LNCSSVFSKLWFYGAARWCLPDDEGDDDDDGDGDGDVDVDPDALKM